MNDVDVLAAISDEPGMRLIAIMGKFNVGYNDPGYRALDRALQRMRKSGAIEYRNGWYLKRVDDSPMVKRV